MNIVTVTAGGGRVETICHGCYSSDPDRSRYLGVLGCTGVYDANGLLGYRECNWKRDEDDCRAQHEGILAGLAAGHIALRPDDDLPGLGEER